MIPKFTLYVEVKYDKWINPPLGDLSNSTWIPPVNSIIMFGYKKYIVIGYHCLFPDTVDVLCEYIGDE
jgi:hypothetical protein